MEKFISVDCGKDDTKVCIRNVDGTFVKRSFPTRMNELTGFESLGATKGYQVEYEGKGYVVGDGASGITSNSNSKKEMIHKIATLTAIATAVENGDSVKVVIGCPLSFYPDKAEREEYANFILPKGRVEIKVNGVDKNFYISARLVLAESYGIVFYEPEKFANKYVGVIDIGGLNLNAAAYKNNQLISESCFTEKLGKNTIMKALQTKLNEKLDADFSFDEMEIFIHQGYVTNAEAETAAFMKNYFKEHLAKVWQKCTNNRWNLKYMDLVFIGGTSLLLKPYILEEFPNAYIPEDANFVNAEGFLMALCAAFKTGIVKS